MWQAIHLFSITGKSVTIWVTRKRDKGGILTNGKVHHASPETGHRYTRRSTLSLTSELDGDRQSTPYLGCFTLGKEIRHPLHSKMGGVQSRPEKLLKISPIPGFDLRTVQSLVSRKWEYSFEII
jgi:hypothetical protein